MARRVITPTLFDDEFFGALPDRAALIWIALFGVIADDQGRLIDNPMLIRARSFPYRDVPVSDVVDAVKSFVEAGKLVRYEADGKTLLQIVNWWKHQRPQWTSRSAWPAPPGWRDRVRTREGNEYIVDGWDEPGGFAASVQVNPSGEEFSRAVETNPSGTRTSRPVQSSTDSVPSDYAPAALAKEDKERSPRQERGTGCSLDLLEKLDFDGRLRRKIGEQAAEDLAGAVCAKVGSLSPLLTCFEREKYCEGALYEVGRKVSDYLTAHKVTKPHAYACKVIANAALDPAELVGGCREDAESRLRDILEENKHAGTPFGGNGGSVADDPAAVRAIVLETFCVPPDH